MRSLKEASKSCVMEADGTWRNCAGEQDMVEVIGIAVIALLGLIALILFAREWLR